MVRNVEIMDTTLRDGEQTSSFYHSPSVLTYKYIPFSQQELDHSNLFQHASNENLNSHFLVLKHLVFLVKITPIQAFAHCLIFLTENILCRTKLFVNVIYSIIQLEKLSLHPLQFSLRFFQQRFSNDIKVYEYEYLQEMQVY